MLAFRNEWALIVGSTVALGLGLLSGAHFRLGPKAEPTAEVAQPAAESLAAWSAPSAEAAEPESVVQPTLYVQSGGQWVTETEREARRAGAQAKADTAAQAAADQAATDQAVASAQQPAEPWTAVAAPVANEGQRPPPTPLLISRLSPGSESAPH